MTQSLKDLVADVREQVAFLQELGVEAIDARLPDAATPIAASADPVMDLPVREPAPEKLEVPQPQRRSAGQRLASLPSLAKRTSTPGIQAPEITAPGEPNEGRVKSGVKKVKAPTLPVVELDALIQRLGSPQRARRR